MPGLGIHVATAKYSYLAINRHEFSCGCMLVPLLVLTDASHPLTLSPSHPLTLSPSHPLTLSPSHPLTLSPSHPLTLSPSHPLTLSPSHPLTLSPSLPYSLPLHTMVGVHFGRVYLIPRHIKHHCEVLMAACFHQLFVHLLHHMDICTTLCNI